MQFQIKIYDVHVKYYTTPNNLQPYKFNFRRIWAQVNVASPKH